MKKLFLLSCILSLSLFVQAQTEDDGFETFWTAFSQEMKIRDAEAVASFTQFPFGSFDFKTVMPDSLQDSAIDVLLFKEYFDKFFTKKRIDVLLDAPHTKTELYGEENETYAVVFERGKNYTMWLTFGRDEETKMWMLVGSDNVSGD